MRFKSKVKVPTLSGDASRREARPLHLCPIRKEHSGWHTEDDLRTRSQSLGSQSIEPLLRSGKKSTARGYSSMLFVGVLEMQKEKR
jgi:hypothetical protein